MRKIPFYLFSLLIIIISGCANSGEKTNFSFKKGEYGYDLEFLKKEIEVFELISGDSRILVTPEYAGRVMTSSSAGLKGYSHGWINYELISSSEINNDANPYGGEERIWLGPEGGQFSLFFDENNKNLYKVPDALDHEAFNIEHFNSTSIILSREFELKNISGTSFKGKITRKIRLLDKTEINRVAGLSNSDPDRIVAYESENRLKNTGNNAWDQERGTLSIWMLSMLKANRSSTVIIPYRGTETKNLITDYFNTCTEDRIKIAKNAIFFKSDGMHRSKIGIRPDRALPYLGSYDAENNILTIIEYNLPDNNHEYVNSTLKGVQDRPFSGDVINSYNDGPGKNGSRIGNVFELEVSSPAAFLQPGEEIVHVQRIYHINENEDKLNLLSGSLLNATITDIKGAFPD